MARGRHRHAPLHRIAVPAGVAGAAVLCALTALLVQGTALPRLLAVLAAAAAVTAAVLLRRWDAGASRKVARERAAKAALSWRAEERQAELEEAQEQVTALEQKLAAKRAEVARLRTEHAALLRRYAHAENERANALEGRRRLALEAAPPTRALPAQRTDHRTPSGAPTRLTYIQAYDALRNLARRAARPRPPAPRPAQQAGGFDFFGAKPADGPGRAEGASLPAHPLDTRQGPRPESLATGPGGRG